MGMVDELRDTKYKNSLIVFSGGMDSMCILLKEIERVQEEGGNITLLYSESEYIIKSKAKKELQTIRKVIKKVKKDFNISLELIIIKTQFSGKDNFNNYNPKTTSTTGTLLPQSVIWTSNVLMCLPDLRWKEYNIIFGFNLADNFHAYSAKMMKDTIESYNRLMNIEVGDVHVAFPLICTYKESIYTSMMKDYREYYDLAWTCENPDDDGTECGKCGSCNTKYQTLSLLLIKKKGNGKIQLQKVKDQLDAEIDKDSNRLLKSVLSK